MAMDKLPKAHKPTVKFRRMKDKRRLQIMEAALKTFAGRGMAAAGIAEISRAAHISVGTFYLYFQNKEDLLFQLMDECAMELRQTLATAFNDKAEPMDRFENAGRAFFREFCNKRREMVILLLRESVGVSQRVEDRRKEIFQVLISDVAGAIGRVAGRKGRGAKRRDEVVAVSLFGMLERVAYHYYIWETGFRDLRKVEDEALAFIRDGLGSVMPKGN